MNGLEKAPFDPLARYVRDETGLEYENYGACFACAEDGWLFSPRNSNINALRDSGEKESDIRAYWENYDRGNPSDAERHETAMLIAFPLGLLPF